MKHYLRGFCAGIPIGLGYLSVSFSFGLLAISLGFEVWQAVLISMTTVTSAGQLAGIGVMAMPGQYAAMLISQLTINIRYSFMSMSLSQKVSPKFSGIWRWLLGFFMTDEIFAVASAEDEVDPIYFTGLSTAPYLGWSLGTLLGALSGNVLPTIVLSSLCLAIYGMFLAIFLPPAKSSKAVLAVVAIAAALHCAFYYIPPLSRISSGISVSVCAIIAAVLGAVIFPIKEDGSGEKEEDVQ